MSFKFLGREPALWMSLASSTVMFVSAFVFPLTPDQQGVINAASVAVFGLLTALAVDNNGIAPGILGLIKAVLALGIAFGLQMAPDKQAVVMTLASGLVAMFVRTQVTAPVTEAAVKKG